MDRFRVMIAAAIASLALVASACEPLIQLPPPVPPSVPGRSSSVSSRPDLRHPHRAKRRGDRDHKTKRLLVVDPVVSNTVPGFVNIDRIGGTEPSIAVNPNNPNQVAMTSFSGSWASGNAPLWYSADRGRSWTKEFTIPAPPGLPATCPCDQVLDWSRSGRLFGTFLTQSNTGFDVVTGETSDPTRAAAWRWRGNPVQLTTRAHAGIADQPWLVLGPDPHHRSIDDAHVAYDDFAGGPRAQVATSTGAEPPDFTIDTSPGLEVPIITNPGLRLGVDRRRGTLYALFQRSQGASEPRTVSYVLNRSTDGGRTWRLNGSPDGIVVDTVKSDQAPGYKFGGVNAPLGGVDHVAVDPRRGDVYVVYGADRAGTGVGNQLLIRRLSPDRSGGLQIGHAGVVSDAPSAALPSVAVTNEGVVGVLYDTFDGMSSDGFPEFSAHLARSQDGGKKFKDVELEEFSSPTVDDGVPFSRQRVLGDYQQLKVVGSQFFGVFSGNRLPFGGTTSIIDPIFFSAQAE